MLDRATRKKELIAIGALHRAELVVGREAIRSAAQPQALGRAALGHAADLALGAASRRTGFDLSQLDLAAVLPLLAGGISALRGRTGLLKLLLRGGAVSGIAAGIVALLRRRRREAEPAVKPE